MYRFFWLKECQNKNVSLWNKKGESVCISSPNLMTDEGQSLLTVVTELPEVIWSPTPLSKLKWEVMKERRVEIQVERSERKEAIKEIYTDGVLYIYFQSFEHQLPPVIYLKFPTPWGLPVKRQKASSAPNQADSSMKHLALNMWDSHIWKGWTRVCFNLCWDLI